MTMSVTELGDGDIVGVDAGVDEDAGDTGVSSVDVGVRPVVGVAVDD